MTKAFIKSVFSFVVLLAVIGIGYGPGVVEQSEKDEVFVNPSELHRRST